ncbi:MAG: endonuclease/exonuclease/phosphatase family protein [Spirochaetaceae bacterium]|jgi:endonuclease/exonuclease/phosphatase family metal-dependent hydrolase|nr:endonuclease/exonuclease/phosphatase family protein [Spirochaetaceae bacterium]
MQKRSLLKCAGAGFVSVVLNGRLLSLYVLALVLPLACADATRSAPKSLSVLTWNVEALFDGHDDGNEYAEYRAAQGWNEEKYRARLTAIGKAFGRIEEGPPDAAVFIELENESVLNLLAEEYLSKYGYRQGYFAKKDGQSLGTGILSRYPITKAASHSYSRDEKAIPRPISEVWIDSGGNSGGEEIVILICHWKSKLGKPEESQAFRDDAALLIRRISEDIRAEREAAGKTAVPILLAGDFNQTIEEFEEFFVDGIPFAVTRSRERMREDFAERDGPLFWTPWGTELNTNRENPAATEEPAGSYYYRGAWESIDHFFFSGAFFDGMAWDYGGVKVLKGAPWTGNNGTPQSYNPKTGDGLSDHLPLLLTLKAVPKRRL